MDRFPYVQFSRNGSAAWDLDAPFFTTVTTRYRSVHDCCLTTHQAGSRGGPEAESG